MDDLQARRLVRLLRLLALLLILLLAAMAMYPQRFLPKGMSLAEFIQAMLGALMLAGICAAVAFRAWNDYQRKKRK